MSSIRTYAQMAPTEMKIASMTASTFSPVETSISSTGTRVVISTSPFIRFRSEPHDQLAVERVGDPHQGVDAGRPLTALHSRDRGLGRAAQIREFALREAQRQPALRDLCGDGLEERHGLVGQLQRHSPPESLKALPRSLHSKLAIYSKVAMGLAE